MLNQRLEREIVACLGAESPNDQLCIVQCSSALATGAIIFHVYVNREKYSRLTIKTARNPGSDHCVGKEWNVVCELSSRELDSGIIPSPKRKFDLEGAAYYAYQTIPGQTMFARFRNRVFRSKQAMIASFGRQALPTAIELHSIDSRLGSRQETEKLLREELSALQALIPDLPEIVVVESNKAISELLDSETAFTIGLQHGDFSPYNLIEIDDNESERVGLIDWEHCSLNHLQFLDVLRFISACSMMNKNNQSYAELLRIVSSHQNPLAESFLIPWSLSMSHGVADNHFAPPTLRAMWVVYWLHAALREQLRSHTPTSWRRSVYLPALIRMLNG